MATNNILAGRRVIVTGAGGGLGAAYARAAAQAGAAVVVNDLDESAACSTVDVIRAEGGEADAFAGDVSDWQVAGAMVDFASARFGGVDGLVNNAGILGRPSSLLDENPESVARVLRVNVLGTVYPAIHTARAMVAAGAAGAIVNVSSGNQTGYPAVLGTYGASKGAVSTLTYAWAVDLAERGIRVNAILPNAVTPMITNALRDLGGESVERERPMPSPEENAGVVTYLLSDRACDVTGQVVRVDHGKLSIMSHPAVVAPQIPSDLTPDGISTAFDESLRDAFQPVGISLVTVEHHGNVY